jgi:hypothetical protein
MSTTIRIDPYSFIHAALRRALFEATLLVARVDFGGEAWRDAEAALARCFGFYREHGDIEDRFVQPVLARLDGDVAARLDAEHAALERSLIAVESLWPRIGAAAAGDERRVLGAELRRRLHTLVAEQLLHMDREERDGNRVLWAELTDAELTAIRDAAGRSLPPARQAAWAQLLGAA